VAVPVYEQLCSTMRTLEHDLIQHFAHNHTQRESLVQSLEDYDTAWQSTYSRLMGRVLDKGSSCMEVEPSGNDNSANESGGKQKNATVKVRGSSKVAHGLNGSEEKNKGVTSNSDHNDDEEEEEEPDWEALLQHEQSHESIQLFLEGRDRWQTACQMFSNALDEMHEQLKATNSEILQTVVEAYDVIMNEDLEEQQNDIQEHLAANFQRRQFLENALEEAIKQQQGMFAKLMARVVGTPSAISSAASSFSLLPNNTTRQGAGRHRM
jgi:hypothetical protein